MKIHGKIQHAANSALSTMCLLLCCFVVHRLYAYWYLNSENKQAFTRIADILFIGVLSDFWIAALGSVAVFLVSIVLAKFKLLKRCVFIAAYSLIVASLCVHQGYVEFFRIQMLLFHFKYLLDATFLSANETPFPTFTVISQAFVYVVLGFWWLKDIGRERIAALPIWGSLLVAALGGHMLNINWRVQHFVPEYLQANVYEKLYMQSVKSIVVPKLDDIQLKQLYRQIKGQEWQGPTDQVLESLVTWNSRDEVMQDFAVALKKKFTKAAIAGDKPIALVVLLESARPSDFSIYAETSGLVLSEKLTPRFDELATKGVWFENAYSTGTVTRAGQEAVWCGTLSSMYSSLMRERTDLNWPCLPLRLDSRVEPFWFHGGDPDFDSQKAFWTKQHVNHLWARDHFLDDTGKGWGISDKRLFEESAEGIRQLRSETTKRALLGQILTLTNHIPWNVPADFDNPELLKRLGNKHPSALTTAYVDYAIGAFVDQLKKIDLWKHSVIIFVSDHGAKIPSFYPLYEDDPFKNARSMSHIVLLLSGGMTETLVQEGVRPTGAKDIVSQAGIAAFLGWLLNDTNGTFATEPLLSQHRRAPVFSQLETSYFFPEHPSEVKRSDLRANATSNLESVANKDYAYLNAFLNFLERPRIEQHKK